jgi:hypothetical protein
MRKIAAIAHTSSVDRARRVRGDSSSTTTPPTTSPKGTSPKTFGSTSNHRGIASAKKNVSLRNLVSRVTLERKPAAPTATATPACVVPAVFADAPAAVSFLESEVSRTNPALLRATTTISSTLSSNKSQLINLRRETEMMRGQLQNQTDARAIQRKLDAATSDVERCQNENASMIEENKNLKKEMSELQKKLRLHQEGTCVSSLLHMFRNHNVAVVCMLCFAWWIKDLGQHVSCAAACCCCCCCCLLTFYIHFYLFFSQFFLFSFFTAHYRHRIRDKSLDT